MGWTWTEPKTDWQATDPVTHTQLNNIGEDLHYLNRIVVPGGASCSVGAGLNLEVAAMMVTVPDDKDLVLSHWRLYFDDTDITLKVISQIRGGANQVGEESSTYYADEDKDVSMYENTTGDDVDILLHVYLHNNSGGSVNVTGGWWLQFHLEDV